MGAVIQTHPQASLAACLGHPPSIELLSRQGLAIPTLEGFRADRELDPNPFGLDLPADYLDMCFVVRVLALWGPDALIQAAAACAKLQLQKQAPCAPRHAKARDAAFAAMERYLEQRSEVATRAVRQAAADCAALYEPFEEDPDSDEATATWNELGAPWFAAETIAQDFALSEWDGPGPREASGTWGNRVSEWPKRAADAAAHWTSVAEVGAAIRKQILSLS